MSQIKFQVNMALREVVVKIHTFLATKVAAPSLYFKSQQLVSWLLYTPYSLCVQ
jgi:hypothetical protein